MATTDSELGKSTNVHTSCRALCLLLRPAPRTPLLELRRAAIAGRSLRYEVMLVRALLAVAIGGVMAAACATEERQTPPPTATSADTAGESVVDIARRHYALVPDSVLVRSGACPFECCTYGQWRAETPIPIMTEPRVSAPQQFAIDSGARFRADTGFVRVTGPAIIAVHDTVFIGADRRVHFVPGDTLVVLDYVGEGHFNVWQRGRIIEAVGGFWGAEVDDPRGAYYGDYRKEWWVRARLPDGRAGWFRADSTFRYSGADACGGPAR